VRPTTDFSALPFAKIRFIEPLWKTPWLKPGPGQQIEFTEWSRMVT
jgi:hypothetical protein